MSQSSGSSGRGDVKWPDLDTWVEPGWPHHDPGWPPGSAAPKPHPARVRRLTLPPVAVLGVALGAGIALAVTYRPAGQASASGVIIAPSASAAPSSAPSAVTPSRAPSLVAPSHASGGLTPGSGAALPGKMGALPGGNGGGAGGQMLFLGKVTALSKNSITLSAQGHTVTAELTGSTRITGRLKLGDAFSAQITTVAGASMLSRRSRTRPACRRPGARRVHHAGAGRRR